MLNASTVLSQVLVSGTPVRFCILALHPQPPKDKLSACLCLPSTQFHAQLLMLFIWYWMEFLHHCNYFKFFLKITLKFLLWNYIISSFPASKHTHTPLFLIKTKTKHQPWSCFWSTDQEYNLLRCMMPLVCYTFTGVSSLGKVISLALKI